MALNSALFANPQLFQAYQSDPRLGYAQALMQQGASAAPVRSPLEGLARALQGGIGGFMAGQTRKGYEQQGEQYRQGLAEALKGGDVIGALSSSNQPMLQQMALEAKVKQAMEKPANSFKTLTDDEEKALGLPTAGTYQRDSTGKVDVLAQPPSLPAVQQNYQEAVKQGFKGTLLDYQKLLAQAGASQNSVNVNLPKSINAGDVKTMELGAEAAMQGNEILPLFSIARESAKQFPQSGALGEGALLLERVKALFGLDNNAQAGEVLQAMQTRLGSLLRIPGSGATSNMEMSLYMQGVPSLLNTQPGNIALADIGEKLVKRRLENYQKLQEYITQNGSSVGYKPDDTPLLTPEDMAILGGQAPAAKPPMEGAKQAPDGNWYIPDPGRPGKYLQVEVPQ